MLAEIRAGNDLVIGSRFMECGGVKKWPLKRRFIALGETFLGRLIFLVKIRDPVSSVFAVKSVVEHAPLKPRDINTLLEVLGKGTWEKEKEIPIEFMDWVIGAGKPNGQTIVDYSAQVIDNARYSWNHHNSLVWQEWMELFKFGMVGLSGIAVNEGVLIYLKEGVHFALPVASIFAIELSIVSNFIWNDLWTFKS